MVYKLRLKIIRNLFSERNKIMTKNNLSTLKVSENSRHLIKEDGSPFFWLGDTAWELFNKLDREEASFYLKQRASQGYNVIQAVALAEYDGLTLGNAYGRRPLLKDDEGNFSPSLPDISKDSGTYDYWDHVDFIIDEAASQGLYIALLPTWGDKFNLLWGKGPIIFDEENSYIYGKWLGQRYADRTNIIWVLGGDRPLETRLHFSIINNMAKGIKEGDGDRHLMTFHPMGGRSSSYHVHGEDWLDFNMIQSSHGSLNIENYKMLEEDYKRQPIKPTFDAEPCYEDHPIGFKVENGYFDDVDIRKAAYWAVFAGAMGHTYGHHCIWYMSKKSEPYFIMDWKRALDRPGGKQMIHLRNLMESKNILSMFPDQDIVIDNYEGANYIAAIRDEDYAFLYSPSGLEIRLDTRWLKDDYLGYSWFNPRDGSFSPREDIKRDDKMSFLPPSSGRGEDWVLVLDSSN